MGSPFARSPEFLRLLEQPSRDPGGRALDLGRIALEIAADAYPGLDIEAYLARVDALAARVLGRRKPGARPRQTLEQVNWVLFVEEGYHGNTADHDDPRNSYLNEVIERKTGIPISLAVLYWRVAGAVGVEMAGANLPAHFMLRVGSGDDTTFIDAFHGGAFLDRAGCERTISRRVGQEIRLSDRQIAPCTLATVVIRMLRNLKAVYLQTDDYPALLPVQRRLTALAAREPQEHHDLAMLCLRLDRPAEALAPLQTYVESLADSPEAANLRDLLRAARREVAQRN